MIEYPVNYKKTIVVENMLHKVLFHKHLNGEDRRCKASYVQNE